MESSPYAPGEYHSNKYIRVIRPASEQPNLVRIVFFGVKGHMAAHALLSSRQEASNDLGQPFEYAGGHAGMPRNEVWAMSRSNDQPIEPYLEAIVQEAEATAKQYTE